MFAVPRTAYFLVLFSFRKSVSFIHQFVATYRAHYVDNVESETLIGKVTL